MKHQQNPFSQREITLFCCFQFAHQIKLLHPSNLIRIWNIDHFRCWGSEWNVITLYSLHKDLQLNTDPCQQWTSNKATRQQAHVTLHRDSLERHVPLLMATSTDRTEIVWDSSSECLMRLSLLNCKMNTTHRKSLQNKHEQKDKKKLVRMENLPYWILLCPNNQLILV